MRKNIFIAVLIPLMYNWGFPQVDYRVYYHPQINNAELAIIDGDYKSALDHYQMAFQRVGTGFGRDYYNALLCAIEVNDFDVAFTYLTKLASKGIEKEFFTQNEAAFEKLRGKGFEAFLDGYEELKEKTFGHTVDYELIGRLGELENRDQQFRYDFVTFRDTIAKIDKSNIEAFVILVDKKGFPSEEMIGLQSPFADYTYYNLIVWHHLKNWKSDSTLVDIRPILIEAVKLGKLSPEVAAEYLNVSESRIGGIGGYGNIGAIALGGYDQYYLLDYDEEQKDVINSNRLKLGFYSENDFEKKARYHYLTEKRQSKFEVIKLGQVNRYPEELKDKIKLKELK